MAKTVLMRSNVVALCASQARFFCSRSLLPCFQATKPSVGRQVLMLPLKTSSTVMHPVCVGGVGGYGSESKFGSRRSLSSIRATTQVNDSGSIDSPLIQSMEKKIKEDLNAESVIVKDAYGDGRHVIIDVVSSSFEGQSAVNRQRMVYKAIWEELQNIVHAVDQMTTRTPAEAADKKGSSIM